MALANLICETHALERTLIALTSFLRHMDQQSPTEAGLIKVRTSAPALQIELDWPIIN